MRINFLFAQEYITIKSVAMKKVCAAAIVCFFFFSAYSQHSKKTHYHPESQTAGAIADVADEDRIDPGQIDIVRDHFGVPHIFAKTDREVAYGLAWAHSEDDFGTIQKAILASKSMLAQFSGKEGAQVDYVVHLLRLRELVARRYASDISPDFKKVLEGYCAGLNAYAESFPSEVQIKKAFPAVPQDLLTYSMLQLALGCGLEDAIKQIHNGATPPIEWQSEGSNAFAFNSRMTEDGNVYLTINTHHPLEGQVAWYEAHLSSEEGWNIVGALFPGSPVIFTGFNKDLGWTHTVNYPDRLDVYKLQMNPENNLQYRFDNEWRTLEERTVRLKVKVSAVNIVVRKKTYRSVYGPTVITDRGVYSIRTGALSDIRALEQWYRMNKAANFSQFRKALKMEALPSYNLVYGDRYDTIFYLSNGKIPIRKEGYDWKGILPGNTSRTLWSKFYPVEKLPQVLNPQSGYVFNVNHSPFKATAPGDNIDDGNYDVNMGYRTTENNRSIRVREILEGYQKIGYDEFKKMKYDLQLPKTLAFPVNIDTLFLLDEVEHPEISDLIQSLRNWDRRATIESTGATVFAVLFYYVANIYEADNTFKVMTAAKCLDAMHYAKDYMVKHFGGTEVRLGDYQRLVRGNKSLPLGGVPDVLATMYSTPMGNGQMKGAIGDCYIAFAKFTPAGPEIESINCYGASNRAGSPHYDDQADLYQKHQTKQMTLDRTKVYDNAEAIYHPEVLSRVRIPDKQLRARK